MQRGVVRAQPVDEIRDLDIAPHPLRKAPERGAATDMDGLVPDIAIDTRRIRPIRLDRDDIEPVPFDQPARDPRARAIELRCSVGCFAEQHDPCVSKAVKY